MAENRELKVGDWDPMNPTARSPATVARPEAPEAKSEAKEEAPAFNPLAMIAFDPWRFLPLFRKFWWVVLVAGILGFVAGIGLGLWKTETVYTVKVRLVKKQFSSVFRAGRLGEAYAPPKLKPATLISAASSYSAIKRVSDRSKIPVGTLRSSFEFKEERKTDLMGLTVWTTRGQEAAASLANYWAEEIVNYTRELQAKESRSIRVYLEEQIRGMDLQVAQIERKILEQIERNGTVNPEKEIEAYLRSLTGLELEFHNARIELESIDAKIGAMRQALRQQSPTVEQLRKIQEEYKELLSKYTETNPLVIEAADNIAQLEKQIRDEQESDQIKEDAFTGTGISDALYLELMQLENQKKLLTHQRDELERLVSSSRDRLKDIPEQSMVYQQFLEQKRSLLSARELLFSRLQEARLFENKAPGYLNVLALATPQEVHTSDRTVKTALAGGVFGVFFGGLAFVSLIALELFSPKLKTAKELEYVFGSSYCACITPQGFDAIPAAQQNLMWGHWMGKQIQQQPHAVWIPENLPEETAVWQWVLERSNQLVDQVILFDLTVPFLTYGQSFHRFERNSEIKRGISYYQKNASSMTLKEVDHLFYEIDQINRRGAVVWIRMATHLEEPYSTMIGSTSSLTIMADPSSLARNSWKEHAILLRSISQVKPKLLALNQVPAFSLW
ncbi:MAG: hypothetical protein AAF558_05340 [Verrucomicrobiota bacterium]